MFYFSSFTLKKNYCSIEEDNLQKKLLVKEELRGVDTDGIGNLEDSPRLVFIDEERGNRIVACDGVFTKGNSQTF